MKSLKPRMSVRTVEKWLRRYTSVYSLFIPGQTQHTLFPIVGLKMHVCVCVSSFSTVDGKCILTS